MDRRFDNLDAGLRVIMEEIRDLRREAAEDRKRLDRHQRQADEDRKDMSRALVVIGNRFNTMNKIGTQIVAKLESHTKLLRRIDVSTRAHRKGRNGR